MSAPPYTITDRGLKLTVRLTPKASRTRIEGLSAEAQGGAAIKVAVTPAPESGKANAALIKLLAREWRLPKSSIAIERGATARRKTLVIAGDGGALAKRLDGWFQAREG
ncbi:MAG: DUF167 domain-containing protein [Alphaproteobacteria bacterium]